MDSLSVRRLGPFLEALLLLVFFQLLRALLEALLIPLLPQGFLGSALAMGLLAALIAGYAWLRGQRLPLLPKRFSKGWVAATVLALALLVSAPANYLQGPPAVVALLYGCIATPACEELLFRGFLWERLAPSLRRNFFLWAWVTGLFTLWHLGYVLPQLLAGNWAAVLGKLAAGLGYGAVLGLVRLKSGNCYGPFLAHSLLNLFMI